MKRTLPALLLSVATACTAYAGLAPQAEATLYRHMLEVNAQWRTMDPAIAADARTVHFSDDAERIAMHLHLVEAYLKEHLPAGLAPEALAQRRLLLNDLDAYADRGVFPRNQVLHYRNPIFIDPYGTACAVGQLIIASGQRELAERIDREWETAYIADLIGSPTLAVPLKAWADSHGFTTDELAWIQPTYGPPPGWVELGGGTSGSVTTLLTLTDGDLLVAGAFLKAGGLERKHVARWNGSTYEEMGKGLNGQPMCAVEFSGKIIVGGSFQSGLRDLAVWNGTTWTYTNVFPGMYPEVHALHIHNGRLYAAGSSSGFAGTDHEVRRWASGSWLPVGGKLNGSINAMTTYWGALTIGGNFTGHALFGGTDTSVQHVAQLVNNDWQQLTDGLNAPVYDLELMNGELYAAGDAYDANGNSVFGFARQPLYAPAWEMLLDPAEPLLPVSENTRINALHTVQNSAMYLGGRFELGAGPGVGKNLAVVYNGQNTIWPTAHVNKDVYDIATHGGEVVFGGAFTSQVSFDILTPWTSELDHVAIWSDGGDWQEWRSLAVAGLEFGLWPNPATDGITINYLPETHGNLLIRDAMGRVVLSEAYGSNAQRSIDLTGLAPGLYSVVITDSGDFGTRTFIKN